MNYKIVKRTGDLISLSKAKAHLRVTHDLEDALIIDCINAATSWAEQYTGLALADYEIIAYTASISSVYRIGRYLPIDAIQAVKTSQGANVDATFMWPNIIMVNERLNRDNYPLEISYTASPSNVPQDVKNAVLLKISDLYEFRTDRQISINREGNYRRVAEDLLQMHKQDNFVI